MIRRSPDVIVAENEAVIDSRGEGRMPDSGIYIPEYKGVNNVLLKAGGKGAITFLDALGAYSSKAMAEQQAVYDKIEASSLISDVDQNYRSQYRNFVDNSPEGSKGLTEFATGTYDSLAEEAVKKASNSNVGNFLKSYFTGNKADIANNAFKEEKENYTGYALNKVSVGMNETLNKILIDPDRIAGYSNEYFVKASTMEHIYSKADFEKFKTQSMNRLGYTYGIGLIKKDPYTAKELLKGEYFVKNIDAKHLGKLNTMADAQILHAETLAYRRENAGKKAVKSYERGVLKDFELGFLEGTKGPMDIENADVSEMTKKEMRVKYAKVMKSQDKQIKVNEEMGDALTDKRPANVSSNKKAKYFMEHITAAEAQSGQPMSLTAKVQYAKDNAVVYNCSIDSLKTACEHSIKNGKNVEEIFDACVAVKDNNEVPAIKGVDKSIRDFADIAVVTYQGSDKSKLLELRDIFFKEENSATVEFRKSTWNNEYSFGDKSMKLLDEFYDDYGYDSLFKKKHATDDDKKLMNASVLKTMERVYKKTGSLSIAKIVTNQYIENLFKRTYINSKHGEEAKYMVNPPREENTGIPDWQSAKVLMLEAGRALGIIKGEKIIPACKDVLNSNTPVGTAETLDKRRIMFQAVKETGCKYNMYYLLNDKDPDSKEFLYDKDTNTRIIVDVKESFENIVKLANKAEVVKKNDKHS